MRKLLHPIFNRLKLCSVQNSCGDTCIFLLLKHRRFLLCTPSQPPTPTVGIVGGWTAGVAVLLEGEVYVLFLAKDCGRTVNALLPPLFEAPRVTNGNQLQLVLAVTTSETRRSFGCKISSGRLLITTARRNDYGGAK